MGPFLRMLSPDNCRSNSRVETCDSCCLPTVSLPVFVRIIIVFALIKRVILARALLTATTLRQ